MPGRIVAKATMPRLFLRLPQFEIQALFYNPKELA